MTTQTAYTSDLITRRDPNAPALWIGCLAAYNAGTLHGAWMQASSDTAEMFEAVAEILAASPEPHAEEWEIMDTDNMPTGASLDRAAAYVATLEELDRSHTANAAEIVAAWIDWRGWDELSAEKVEDAYLGQYDSAEDYAAAYTDDSGSLQEVPEFLRPYIDYKAMGRDMELNGDIYEGKHGHFFNGHA